MFSVGVTTLVANWTVKAYCQPGVGKLTKAGVSILGLLDRQLRDIARLLNPTVIFSVF